MSNFAEATVDSFFGDSNENDTKMRSRNNSGSSENSVSSNGSHNSDSSHDSNENSVTTTDNDDSDDNRSHASTARSESSNQSEKNKQIDTERSIVKSDIYESNDFEDETDHSNLPSSRNFISADSKCRNPPSPRSTHSSSSSDAESAHSSDEDSIQNKDDQDKTLTPNGDLTGMEMGDCAGLNEKSAQRESLTVPEPTNDHNSESDLTDVSPINSPRLSPPPQSKNIDVGVKKSYDEGHEGGDCVTAQEVNYGKNSKNNSPNNPSKNGRRRGQSSSSSEAESGDENNEFQVTRTKSAIEFKSESDPKNMKVRLTRTRPKSAHPSRDRTRKTSSCASSVITTCSNVSRRSEADNTAATERHRERLLYSSSKSSKDLNQLLEAVLVLDQKGKKQAIEPNPFPSRAVGSAVSSARSLTHTGDRQRQIQKENDRLLKELTKQRRRPASAVSVASLRSRGSTVSMLSGMSSSSASEFRKSENCKQAPVARNYHSKLNRTKEEKRIEQENLALLRRIQNVRPSTEIQLSRRAVSISATKKTRPRSMRPKIVNTWTDGW